MLKLYSGFKNEMITVGGYSNDIKLRIYSSNDPISNAYFIGESNHALYIVTPCNTGTYVGIGTVSPQSNLHVDGNVLFTGSLNLGATLTTQNIITQNASINAGSGGLTVGTINTQGNPINTGSGAITSGTITASAITTTTINTQGNTINTGTGAITSGTITAAAITTTTINTQGNTIVSGALTTTTINTQGNTINTGTGAITSGTITAGALTTTTINTQGNTINTGTGAINVGAITAAAVTTASINTQGNTINTGTGAITSGTITAGALTTTTINTQGNTINTGTGAITSGTITAAAVTTASINTQGNTIVAGALTTTTINTQNNAINTGNGEITGGYIRGTNLLAYGTLTTSNLVVLGSNTTINSIITSTSNFTISNVGGGTALTIYQNSVLAPAIFQIYDTDYSSTIPTFEILDAGPENTNGYLAMHGCNFVDFFLNTTTSTINTQNNTINAGSGALTVGTINTQGNAITSGTITATAITTTTINTQGNTINTGTGAINVGAITAAAVTTSTINTQGNAITSGTITATAITTTTINTQNNTINAGSGALTVGTINTQGNAITSGTITATAITTTTINTQGNTINTGTGAINVGAITSAAVTTSTINTQGNAITSGTITATAVTTTTINTQGNTINTGTGAINVGAITAVAVTTTTINTQGNTINTGTGAINVGAITSAAVTTTTINTQGNAITSGTITSTAVTTTTINTQGNTINTGTGALNVGAITSGAISSSSINTQNNNINVGSGAITSSNITTSNLTSVNINFTGALLQNGSPYIGSQWTTSNNNPATGSNSIYIIGSNVGIGTAIPQSNLDVWGTMSVTVSGQKKLSISSNQTTFGFDTLVIPFLTSTTLNTSLINTSNIIATCNIGIGTTLAQSNLDVWGTVGITISGQKQFAVTSFGTIINTGLTTSTINTQGNTINTGTGAINVGAITASAVTTTTINTQGNTINTGTGAINVGAITSAAVTTTTINTQGNTINTGTGAINVGAITSAAVTTTTINTQGNAIISGTISATAVTTTTINTQGNTINTGTGALNVGAITSAAVTTTTINTQGNTINTGTGAINVGVITASAVTTTTINTQGNTINTGTGAINVGAITASAVTTTTINTQGNAIISGTISATAVTTTTINTQNNNINAGSGTIRALNIIATDTLTTSNLIILGSNLIINTITTETSNFTISNILGSGPALSVYQSGTGISGAIANFFDYDVSKTIPVFSIADQGIINISGNQFVDSSRNITAGAITTTTINTQNNNINAGSGTITASNLNAFNITASNLLTACNINFTGALLQNGAPYIGSQWSTATSNNIKTLYILGSNVGIGTSIATCNLTVVGNASFTGNIYAPNLSNLNGIYTQTAIYQPAPDGSLTIQPNNSTSSARVLYSFLLNQGPYLINGTLSYLIESGLSSNLITASLYNTSPASFNAATDTPIASVQFPTPTPGSPAASALQTIPLQWYVTVPKNGGGNQPYIIAINGTSNNTLVFSPAAYSNVSPTSNIYAIPTSLLGANNGITTTQTLQPNPVRSTTYVSTGTQSVFQLNAIGYFTAAASNVDVFINGSKYAYQSSNAANYSLLTTFDGVTTSFTISLTTPVSASSIVDIIVWPQVTPTSYFTPGYLYQSITGTFIPWQNVQGGGVRVNDKCIIDGDVYISGNIYSQCNTSTFVSGISGIADANIFNTYSNIVGTNNITDGAITPAKLNLTSGSIGIGTTLPLQLLDVRGGINFTGELYYSNMPFSNILQKAQWVYGSNEFGPNIIILNSNVGIGTTNPTSPLTVYGISTFVGPIYGTTITAGDINFTGSLLQNGSPYIGSQWTTASNTPAPGSNSIYIIYSNVGIGTTIPRSNLDVWGTMGVTINGYTQFSISSNETTFGFNTINIPFINSALLTVSADITASNVIASNVTAFNVISSNVTVANNVTAQNINFTGALLQNGSPYIGSQWTTSNNNPITGSNSIYIINSNVGIGTITPQTSLHVIGNALISNNVTATNINFTGSLLQNGSPYIGSQWTTASNTPTSGENSIYILNSNVGIGTTIPQSNLDVWGTFGVTVGGVEQFGVSDTSTMFGFDTMAVPFVNSTIITSTISVATSNVIASNITVASNITATNINFTGALLQNGAPYIGSQWTTVNDIPTSGANSIIILNSNVGIGTTSPQTPLHVIGDALISDNVTATNINFTGALLQNGSPYIGSQWTTINNVPTTGANSIYILNSNIGIGTTSPQAAFHVVGKTMIDGTLTSSTGTLNTSNIIAQNINVMSNEYIFGSTFTSKIIINDSGIFTNQYTPNAVPIVCTAITCTTINTQSNSINAGNGSVTASNIYFSGNLYQNGTLFVGGGGGQWNYSNVSNIYYAAGAVSIGASNNQGYTLYVGNSNNLNGTIGAYGNIYAFLSDERLKDRIGPIDNALEKVCSLEGFKYIHNDIARSYGYTDDEEYVGVSAQQVQRVLPEVVKPAPFDADNHTGQNYLTVQYERIVPLLIESIKELRQEVAELRIEVKQLREKQNYV